jgi:hypothetical protein
MSRTADSFYKALKANDKGRVTMGAYTDFGLQTSTDPDKLFSIYQNLINQNNISSNDLHKRAGNGKDLTHLISKYGYTDQITTLWDTID